MVEITKRQQRMLKFLYDGRGKNIDINDIAAGLCLSEKNVTAALRALQELGLVDGPPSLLSQCQKFLSGIGVTGGYSPDYSAGIVLVASVITGHASEEYLSDELGYDHDFVSVVGSRLRNAKIWQGDEVPEALFNRWRNEDGGIAFSLDLSVAIGVITCTEGDTDNPHYQITPEGRRRGERLIAERGYSEQ